MTAYCTANGLRVDWLCLDVPFMGLWTARARLDIGDGAAPTGALTLAFDTGDEGASPVTWSGTILESTADEGEASVYVVAGSGGLVAATGLAGADYDQPPPRVVAAAILEAAKETPGDLTVLDALPRIEPVYTRLRGRGVAQLDALARRCGVRWRAAPSGAIDVPNDTWPPADAFIVRRWDDSGRAAAEPDLPTLLPGIVVDGRRVSRVQYTVNEDGLSAVLYGELP
jgi:hypothetical protein